MIWGYHYFRKHPCEPSRILPSDTLKGMKCTHNHQGFIPPKVLRGPDFMWFFGNIQFRHFNLTKTSLLGSNLVLRRITGSVHIVHRDRVGPGCFCLRTWDWLHPLFLEEVITHATCYQLLQKAVVSTKHMKIHLPKLGKGINIYIYIHTIYILNGHLQVAGCFRHDPQLQFQTVKLCGGHLISKNRASSTSVISPFL